VPPWPSDGRAIWNSAPDAAPIAGHLSYNSCRNRHWPRKYFELAQNAAARKAAATAWLAARRAEAASLSIYVICVSLQLPHQLAAPGIDVAKKQTGVIYGLLFAAAARNADRNCPGGGPDRISVAGIGLRFRAFSSTHLESGSCSPIIPTFHCVVGRGGLFVRSADATQHWVSPPTENEMTFFFPGKRVLSKSLRRQVSRSARQGAPPPPPPPASATTFPFHGLAQGPGLFRSLIPFQLFAPRWVVTARPAFRRPIRCPRYLGA